MKTSTKVALGIAFFSNVGYELVKKVIENRNEKKIEEENKKIRQEIDRRRQAQEEENKQIKKKYDELERIANSSPKEELIGRMRVSMFQNITSEEALKPNICNRTDRDFGDVIACQIWQDQLLKMMKK